MDAPTREAWESEFHDPQDDWLFASISQYKKLHMFELQNPTQTIAWIDVDRVCVACQHKSGKSEILELAVPDKLLLEEEQEGLSKNRDFNLLSGGFCETHVSDIKHIPQTRCIVTAEKGDNCVRLWELGDEKTDIIKMSSQIKSCKEKKHSSSLTVLPGSSDKIAFGDAVNNICVASISSSKMLFNSSDLSSESRISGLHSLDPHTFATCEVDSGAVWVIDTRQKMENCQAHHTTEDSGRFWTVDFRIPCSLVTASGDCSGNVTDLLCIRLNSSGFLEKLDLRQLKLPVASLDTGISMPLLRGFEYAQVHCAPGNSHDVLLSGFDGNAYVYDTKYWQTESFPSEKDQCQPCQSVGPKFIHEGHKACSEDDPSCLVIWCSVWHPTIPDLALSAAGDGSLHAWAPAYRTQKVPHEDCPA